MSKAKAAISEQCSSQQLARPDKGDTLRRLSKCRQLPACIWRPTAKFFFYLSPPLGRCDLYLYPYNTDRTMPLTATLTYSISFFGLSIKHITILENTGTRVLVHFILSVGPCALEVILWPMRDIYKAGKPKCSQVFCTKW